MSRARTMVDTTYDDRRSRTGELVRERKIRQIPWEEVDNIRNRELALVRRAASPSPPSSALQRYEEPREPPREGEEDYTVRRVRRYKDDQLLPYRRSIDAYDRPSAYRGGRDRDRGGYYDDESSDSDSSREHRRRRRHREDRRARSERRSEAGSQRQNQQQDAGEDEGRCWYSGKERKDANFFEKRFDSSYDGLIAAAAGAAIGAITVRTFAKKSADEYDADAAEAQGGEMGREREVEREKKKKSWKDSVGLRTLGGAVAGAAILNAGENWYSMYTEEREERKEDKGRERGNGFMPKRSMAAGLGTAAQAL